MKGHQEYFLVNYNEKKIFFLKRVFLEGGKQLRLGARADGGRVVPWSTGCMGIWGSMCVSTGAAVFAFASPDKGRG